MKNNQLTFILVGMVFLMTVFTVALVTKYNRAYNRIQELQSRVVLINTTQKFLQTLLNDATEFGKKNPDILPIVQFATNNPAKPPAAKPAGK